MKAVIAMDSFKGSLPSLTGGEQVKNALLSVYPQAEVTVLPLADGGEGTADALIRGLHGKWVSCTVTGPLGEPVEAGYGLLPHHTAMIEMASCAGLALVPHKQRDPLNTTTYGVGELMIRALSDGCKNFLVAIGGSATNDAGLGMLCALGCRFYRADAIPTGIFGRDVETVAYIDASPLQKRLAGCTFTVACDVTNPLCGETGASAVFGPQKGADPATVQRLDRALQQFAACTKQALHTDFANIPGAGAAGGLGFALLSFLHAELRPGVQLVLEAVGAREALRDADIFATGEGKMDAQTAMGKAPIGAAKLAKSCGVKTVLAFCGCAAPDAAVCNEYGIDGVFPILRLPCTVQQAMQEETARQNLYLTAQQVFRLYQNVRQL